MSVAVLEVPGEQIFAGPAVDFVLAYARALGLEAERLTHLNNAMLHAFALIAKKNAERRSDQPIRLEVGVESNRLLVRLLNRGTPIFSADNSGTLTGLTEAFRFLDRVDFENQGRGGQCLVFQLRLPNPTGTLAQRPGAAGEAQSQPIYDDITLRPFAAGDETALSQLFFFVYEYRYIHEFVYYPERLREMNEQGKLISLVAVTKDGRIVGHVGLLKWADEPAVFEPCLGVVDPLVRSRGLFSRVFGEIMQKAQSTAMSYWFSDCVTNLDFSQRLVAKYGACDLAIFVGAQDRETQASLARLGIGPDSADMARYSLIYSLKPMTPQPFGRSVVLPESLGSLLGFLMKPLHLTWTPAPRFDPLCREGEFTAQYQPAQKSVFFDLAEPGMSALSQVISQWHELLHSGYQYAAVDVPVDSAGLGALYDTLAEQGFFVSGFLPYHHSVRLALRLQAIGPTKVAFDDIRVHSETAKKLLTTIRLDYERNSRL